METRNTARAFELTFDTPEKTKIYKYKIDMYKLHGLRKSIEERIIAIKRVLGVRWTAYMGAEQRELIDLKNRATALYELLARMRGKAHATMKGMDWAEGLKHYLENVGEFENCMNRMSTVEVIEKIPSPPNPVRVPINSSTVHTSGRGLLAKLKGVVGI